MGLEVSTEDAQLRDAKEGRSHQDMLRLLSRFSIHLWAFSYGYQIQGLGNPGFGFRQNRSWTLTLSITGHMTLSKLLLLEPRYSHL